MLGRQDREDARDTSRCAMTARDESMRKETAMSRLRSRLQQHPLPARERTTELNSAVMDRSPIH